MGCPNCQWETISSKARSCPHCGPPFNSSNDPDRDYGGYLREQSLILLVAVIVVIVGVIYFFPH